MKTLVTVPFLGSNDTTCKVIALHAADGAKVVADGLLCSLETTKTVIEVTSPAAGAVHWLIREGGRCSLGEPLAIVADEPLRSPRAALAELVAATGRTDGARRVTQKAEILIARHGIDLQSLREFAGNVPITEKVVGAYLAEQPKAEARHGFVDLERIGIVGGVLGGGALIVVDSLLRQRDRVASCIFERDAAFHGRTLLGVPVVGSSDLVERWIAERRIDAVIIAFNRDLDERAAEFERLRRAGTRFCNLIDPGADVRSAVSIGAGNVILARAYIGAGSRIGDNNFISANVALEHGNQVGSHCAFGPGVMTSGNVTIGDRVRFGTGIFVEPGIRVGDGAIVASGAILTVEVPANTVQRVSYGQSFKLRDG